MVSLLLTLLAPGLTALGLSNLKRRKDYGMADSISSSVGLKGKIVKLFASNKSYELVKPEKASNAQPDKTTNECTRNSS